MARCPACLEALTAWAGYRAAHPYRIRCTACGTKLRVRLPGLTAAFALVIFFAIAATLGMMFLVLRFGPGPGLLALLAFALVWAALEFVAGKAMYRWATFEVADAA